MSQTTALAGATAPAPSTAYYVWSFPGSVTIHLSLDAVARLARQLEMLPQGLLLGRGSGSATEIDDLQILSTAELSSLRSNGELPSMPTGLNAMGYFRVQREGDISLSAEDIALAKAVFTKPDQVFLIIQAGAAGAPTASFFFWDGGQIYGDFAFLEFPFDASQLPGRKISRLEPPRVGSAPVAEPTSHKPSAASFSTDSKMPPLPNPASHLPNRESSVSGLHVALTGRTSQLVDTGAFGAIAKLPVPDAASHPPDICSSGTGSNVTDPNPESHRPHAEFSGTGSKARYWAVMAAICVGACVGLMAGLRSLPSSFINANPARATSPPAFFGLEV
jgi:hypothetical protein